jgi:death-on-curing protein
VLISTGGAPGIRDLGALERSVIEKASALGFALAQGHPFVDGNKRVAHAAMATLLLLNGAEIDAAVGEQERLMLDLASGRLSRTELANRLQQHISRPPDQAV